ncbi:ferritin [Elysia marginata]|uniref:Ferritin n=1 Tax=Elysia marginata TaxID=1093978 RepID=A0AAV4EKM0_9GAST|nr:ferritin [Elysia marginata]
MSQVRQNFSEECEAGINRQINLELYASYTYQSMAFYFDRDDVALPAFFKFFKHQADEEREHAEALMKYQNLRGGKIVLQDVKKPDTNDWTSCLHAMRVALQLEKNVNQALLDLHQVSDTQEDAQMSDFLDGFLQEQVDSINQIAKFVKQVKGVGEGLGEYLFDKHTLAKLDLS